VIGKLADANPKIGANPFFYHHVEGRALRIHPSEARIPFLFNPEGVKRRAFFAPQKRKKRYLTGAKGAASARAARVARSTRSPSFRCAERLIRVDILNLDILLREKFQQIAYKNKTAVLR